MHIRVFDEVFTDPLEYRRQALASEFKSVDLGQVFHGIAAPDGFAQRLPEWVQAHLPGLTPTLTFFRKSPEGQIEPNFVHTDCSMGDWTGIFYLNPHAPEKDGTDFWIHRETGAIKSSPEFDGLADWNHPDKWDLLLHVASRFNRLLMFPAPLFHSRAMYMNYGSADESRLIQVVFGTGDLKKEAL